MRELDMRLGSTGRFVAITIECSIWVLEYVKCRRN
jgi:hypothetical protein